MVDGRRVVRMNASERITDHIANLADWRGKTLARLRHVIRDAAPALTEAWKWKTPVSTTVP
jgi:hypothetical protein